MFVTRLRLALVMGTMLVSVPTWADPLAPGPTSQGDLETGFRDPPSSARPRVWWHWMNGNITKDGIAKDLTWMKRVGIGGVQNFDASMNTPKVVDQRLSYMTPEWKDAFRYAATMADGLGLELAIAGSPGWSETGGPWVQPNDGLKKIVWSETVVAGGRRFTGTLAVPPTVTGPFQAMPMARDGLANAMTSSPQYYGDIAVLAYPDKGARSTVPRILSATGTQMDGAKLLDDDPASYVELAGVSGQSDAVIFDYRSPQVVRSATLYSPGGQGGPAGGGMTARLEAEDHGAWRPVTTITASLTPTTVGFAPVTASRFRLVLPSGHHTKLGLFTLSSDARIDRFETKAAFTLARDYYALTSSANPSDEGVAPDKVIDLTARMRPDGTLDWTPPAGRWRILRLGYSLTGKNNHPASPEATGLEVDKFDAAAVRRYLDTYLSMYRDAAGPDMIGKHGVRALLTDSIEIGPANWTPRLIEQFRRLRGYDPTPWLPTLTGTIIESRTQSDGFLYDFRRTLADLIASEHYGTIAQVAHANNMIVYGEALEDGRPVIGDDMAMRSHTDVPMAAMWMYPRTKQSRPTYIADIKGAASVANIYGQNIVAAESLTSISPPWSDSPSDLRHVIDLEFATGVNRPVIHTSVHQPLDKAPGLSLFIVGQFFNRHESWAEMAKPWVDYMARNSFLLQQGRSVADVAYFYGEEGPLTGLFGDKGITDAPTRYGYDFINTDILTDMLSVENGELHARSGARYRILYLGGSSDRMTLPTLRRIAALAEAGATVVGTAPTGTPGMADQTEEYRALVSRLWSSRPVTVVGQGKVITGRDIEAALAAAGSGPDFSYKKPQPDSQILFAHRQWDGGDLYFVNNRLNRAETVEARFRVTGRTPEIWRADTGTIQPISYRTEGHDTVVPLNFEAEDSFFVVFRKPTALPALTVTQPTFTPVSTLDGPWDVSFQPGRGAPPSIKLPTLTSLSDANDPGVKYFSGVATYTKTFTLPRGIRAGSPMSLNLGKIGDVAEIRLNGRVVGTIWHAPDRIDISGAVRRGKNRLEVRVANVWFNRLVGDAQPGAAKVAFTTIPGASPRASLKPSGLIGPVTIEATQ